MCVFVKQSEKLTHTVKLQCRTEHTRKNFALFNRSYNIRIFNAVGFVKFFKNFIVTYSNTLTKSICISVCKINAVFIKICSKLCHNRKFIRTVKIHFIYKNKTRHIVSFKEFPECCSVTLHTVCTADYKNCIIENLQGALCLG